MSVLFYVFSDHLKNLPQFLPPGCRPAYLCCTCFDLSSLTGLML